MTSSEILQRKKYETEINDLKKVNKQLIREIHGCRNTIYKTKKELKDLEGELNHLSASRSSRCYDGKLHNMLGTLVNKLDFYISEFFNLDYDNTEEISNVGKIIFSWWDFSKFNSRLFSMYKEYVYDNLEKNGITPGDDLEEYLQKVVNFNLTRYNVTEPYLDIYYPDERQNFDNEKHEIYFNQQSTIGTLTEDYKVKYGIYPGLINTHDNGILLKATVVVEK
jgi:hypothetical protein